MISWRGTMLARSKASMSIALAAGVHERGLEPEIFREMEGVRAALHGRAGVKIGGVPSSHRRELVAQRLGEEAILDAAVVAAADELFFQALVDALSVSEARRDDIQEAAPTCPTPEHAEHWLKR